MHKELNINFTFDVKDDKFLPLSLEVKASNDDHSVLAFCIASILYEESKRKKCFSSHVAEWINDIKEEDNASQVRS